MSWFNYLEHNGYNIVYALLILCFGFFMARLSKEWLGKKIRLKSKDPTVKLFIANAIYVLVLLIVVISALARLGIPTASLLTVLGAGSLAIALSLKDSLSHVASGLILVSLKPFHIGDTVEINGVTGTLDQINLLTIKINTPNGDSIVIPNAKVFGDKICTKGKNGFRRIDLTIGIGYDADIKKAKKIVHDLYLADNRILNTPAPIVVVKELADSAVLLAIRPWVQKSDYSNVLYELIEKIKLAFDENNIEIPFPQIDAHIKNP